MKTGTCLVFVAINDSGASRRSFLTNCCFDSISNRISSFVKLVMEYSGSLLLFVSGTDALFSEIIKGRAAFLAAKGKLEHINHIRGSCGTLAASTPLKEGNKSSKDGDSVSFKKSDPVVAFSKPPPLPPVLGPLVALSLLETFSSRDGDED